MSDGRCSHSDQRVEIRYTDTLDSALFYWDIFDNLNPSLSVFLKQESYLLLMQSSSGQIYSILTFKDFSKTFF